MDHAQLSRIERGQEGLSLKTLARLAKVLGLRDLARLLEPYHSTPEMREPGFDRAQGSRDERNSAKTSARA
jgi:transcriptional regulator with XRE-family HTH domain